MHSVIELTGNGSNRRFPVTFTLGPLRREYVRCRVGTESDASGNPLYRALTWDDNDPGYVTVQGTAPGNGVPVVLTREVPVDALLYDFQKGAHLGSVALNESHEQLMMAVHQMIDEFNITMVNVDAELSQAITDAKAIAENESRDAVDSRFNALAVAVQIIPDSQDMGASYNPNTNVLTLYLHEIGLPDGLMDSINSKVSKSGDTMTGTLYVGASGTNRSSMTISGQIAGNELYVYKPNLANDSHYAAISFRTTRQDGTTNTKKTHIISYSEKSASAAGTSDDPSFVIEGKGMLFAGSGESAGVMREVLVTGVQEVPEGLQRYWSTAGMYNDASEHTVISSDNVLHLISNCNTIANAKGAYLNANGHWHPHMAEGQALGSTGARWDAYIRNLNVSGPVALSSSLAVSGSTAISGDLNVSGTITRAGMALTGGGVEFITSSKTWTAPHTGAFSFIMIGGGGGGAYHSGNITYVGPNGGLSTTVFVTIALIKSQTVTIAIGAGGAVYGGGGDTTITVAQHGDSAFSGIISAAGGVGYGPSAIVGVRARKIHPHFPDYGSGGSGWINQGSVGYTEATGTAGCAQITW